MFRRFSLWHKHEIEVSRESSDEETIAEPAETLRYGRVHDL